MRVWVLCTVQPVRLIPLTPPVIVAKHKERDHRNKAARLEKQVATKEAEALSMGGLSRRMAPIPAIVLLRHHLAAQGHDLPNELWNEVTAYTVTESKPVPISLLPTTYKQALLPSEKTGFEAQAKATFWKTIVIYHAQSTKKTRERSEIETLQPYYRNKIERPTFASHAATMSRHITDVIDAIEGCPNIRTLTIEVTIPDANPYMFHAALDTFRSLMSNMVSADVKKTVVVLVEARPFSTESEVDTSKFGVASEYRTKSGINVKVINLAPDPAKWLLRFGPDD